MDIKIKKNKTLILCTILVSLLYLLILSFLIWMLYFVVTKETIKEYLIFHIFLLIFTILNISIVYIEFLYVTFFYKIDGKSIEKGDDKIE